MNKKIRDLIINNRVLCLFAFEVYPLLGAKIINENCMDEERKLLGLSDESFYIEGIKNETIEKLLLKEADRKKIIEDKAKTNVTAVTIAIALVTTILTMFNGTNTYSFLMTKSLTIYMVIVGILGFLYLVISGLCAFRALQLGPIYDIYFNDEKELLGKPDESRCGRLIKNLQLNYINTPRREAYVNASYQGMKNGILALIVFVFLGIIIFSSGKVITAPIINNVYPIKIEVTEVIDVRTFKVKAEGIEEVVQLAFIKPPNYKLNEPYGNVAFEMAKELTLNKKLEMQIINYKMNQKEVAIFISGSYTVNEYLIENGLASCIDIDRMNSNEKRLLDKQLVAKNKRLGIWSTQP